MATNKPASGQLKNNIDSFLRGLKAPTLSNIYGEEYDFRESTELYYEKVVTEKFDFKTSMYDVGSVAGIYPGAIVCLNNNFGTNSPTLINFGEEERATLSIVNPSLPGAPSFNIEQPTYENFVKGHNNMVDKYISCSTQNNSAHNLRAEWDYTEIKSEDHLKATLNVAASSVKLDTSYSKDTTKNYLLAVYRQVFYRLELNDIYNEPSDFFSEKMDLATLKNNLKKKSTNDYYAPGIVRWVDYGRTFYILCASTKTAEEMKAALSYGSYAKADTNYKKTLEQMECKAILIGGDTSSSNIIRSVTNGKQLDVVFDNIEKYARLSSTNRGEAIAFQVDSLNTPMSIVSVTASGVTYKKKENIKTVGLKICHDNSTITNYYVRYMNPTLNRSTKSLEWQLKEEKITLKSYSKDPTIDLPARARFINIVVCQQGGPSDSGKYSIILEQIPFDYLKEDGKGGLYFEFHATGALYKKSYNLVPGGIQETKLMDLSKLSLYEDKKNAKKCFSDSKYTASMIEKTAKYLPELELNKCKSNDGTQIIVEKALEIIYDNWIYKAKI